MCMCFDCDICCLSMCTVCMGVSVGMLMLVCMRWYAIIYMYVNICTLKNIAILTVKGRKMLW